MRVPRIRRNRILPLTLAAAATLTLGLAVARAGDDASVLDITTRMVTTIGHKGEFALDQLGQSGCVRELDRLKQVKLDESGKGLTLGAMASTYFITGKMGRLLQINGQQMDVSSRLQALARAMDGSEIKNPAAYERLVQAMGEVIDFLKADTGPRATEMHRLSEELWQVRRQFGLARLDLEEIRRFEALERQAYLAMERAEATRNAELAAAQHADDKIFANGKANSAIAKAERDAAWARDQYAPRGVRLSGTISDAMGSLSRFRLSFTTLMESISATVVASVGGTGVASAAAKAIADGNPVAPRPVGTGEARAADAGENAATLLSRAKGAVTGAASKVKSIDLLSILYLITDTTHTFLSSYSEGPANQGRLISSQWAKHPGCSDDVVFGSSSDAVCRLAAQEPAGCGKVISQKMGVVEMWRATRLAIQQSQPMMAEAGANTSPLDKRLPDSVITGQQPATGPEADVAL